MRKILAIGAHPDDIEIGCGGTLARHIKEGDEVVMLVLTEGTAGGVFEVGTRVEEGKNGAKELGVKDVRILSNVDTKLVCDNDLIQSIEKVVLEFKPDRAYIPYHLEIHQDHRAVSYASLSALRNTNQVLMYEGPSTFPNFEVDLWVDISKTLEEKKKAIAAHASQGHKEILKIEAIVGMNKYRGFQCRKEFAEGFSVFRMFE